MLREGIRVTDARGREGKVVGSVGPYRVLVLWDGETEDELEFAETLTTVSAMTQTRRRRG